jgi:hypothetical protein
LAGLHFLVQKEKEGLFFFENALKSDDDYLDVFKELFPILIDRKDVQLLVSKFKDSEDS